MVEFIVWIGWDTLIIDGEGKYGVCFGDSGGSFLVIVDDGSIRVIGDFFSGLESCVGEDYFM